MQRIFELQIKIKKNSIRVNTAKQEQLAKLNCHW